LKRIFSIWAVLISIILPFFLIMTSIRFLLTPIFIQEEYNRPGFPSDIYGFTAQDRLYWGNISREYMLNNAGIAFLGDQQISPSQPLYNTRELKHMLDVKSLIQKMLIAWYVLIGALLLTVIFTWRTKTMPRFWRSLRDGGWLTIGLIGSVLLGVAIGFDAIFTGFHRIFFQGDTWLFNYSDTLIRLFPMQFWQDAFIAMGLLCLIASALFILLGGKLGKSST
jgi:integral membrane protein (TIGR01906 family)